MNQPNYVLLEEEGFPFIRLDKTGKVFNMKSDVPLTVRKQNIELHKEGGTAHFNIPILLRKYFFNELNAIHKTDQCSLEFLQLSNFIVIKQGRIWSKHFYRWLDGGPNNQGYYHTSLRNDFCTISCVKIHRVVAMAFIPNPFNYSDVNHIDGNKANNTVDNLEWVTSYMNHLHARSHGLRESALNESQVHEVCKRLISGENQRSIAFTLGISVHAIGHIVNHGSHREIAKQYGIPYKAPIRLIPVDRSKYKPRFSGPLCE